MRQYSLHLVIAFLLCLTLPVRAQFMQAIRGSFSENGKAVFVQGHVQMQEEGNDRPTPLERANVQLYCLTDSSSYTCGITNKEGNFSSYVFLTRGKQYEVHISYLGTDTYKHPLRPVNRVELDTITLHEKPMTLEEAVIVGKLQKMRVLGDTTIFNTDAFKVSEGAVLLELVRKLPGLRLKEGKMTYQGKDIEEIVLNGEKFFSKDITIALQNMPVNLLKEVRIYDKQSEKAEITGVDDGKSTTVMDLKTRESIDRSLMGNTKIGAGDQGLYGGQASLNRFERGGDHASLILNRHNTPNDIGSDFIGMGRMNGMFSTGGPKEKLSQRIDAGFSETLGKVTLGGDVNYSDHTTTSESYTVVENYLPTGNEYADQSSLSSSGNQGINSNFRLNVDFNEHAHLNGNFGYSNTRSNSLGENKSATFKQNPYHYTGHPLEDEEALPLSERINRIEGNNLSDNHNETFNGNLAFIYNFSKEMRYMSFNAQFTRGKNDTRGFQRSLTRYYQLGDSILYQNRYSHAPTRDNNWEFQAAYNEPITKNFNLEFSYAFRTNKNTQDDLIFDVGRLLDADAALGTLPDGYESTRIDSLSNLNETRVRSHTFNLMANINFYKDWRANFSIAFTPEAQHLRMLREDLHIDTTFHFNTFSSQLRLAYAGYEKIFMLSYSGNASAPNAKSLLPITDNSNPLYITTGNPHLKNAYSHHVSINYHDNRFWTALRARQTFNQISTKIDYSPITGARTTYPDNINGNWGVDAQVGYSKDWDFISLEGETTYEHANNVSYTVIDNETHKNTVRNDTYRLFLKGIYTPEWGELTLSAQGTFDHTKNDVQSSTDNFNKTFEFLCEGTFYLPYNIRVSSNFICITRRGFLSSDMNHSELLWNANVSYSFLKKKQANLKFEVFDILQRSTNFYSYVSESSSRQTRSNSISSYFLLSFNYRFSIFKGKKESEN